MSIRSPPGMRGSSGRRRCHPGTGEVPSPQPRRPWRPGFPAASPRRSGATGPRQHQGRSDLELRPGRRVHVRQPSERIPWAPGIPVSRPPPRAPGQPGVIAGLPGATRAAPRPGQPGAIGQSGPWLPDVRPTPIDARCFGPVPGSPLQVVWNGPRHGGRAVLSEIGPSCSHCGGTGRANRHARGRIPRDRPWTQTVDRLQVRWSAGCISVICRPWDIRQ